MAETIPHYQVFLLMLAMALAGSGSTICQKLQNSQEYHNDQKDEDLKYQHPFFQTFIMFTGKLICLPLFHLMKYFDVRKYGSEENLPSVIQAKALGKRTDVNKVLFLIPATFDMLGSTLLFISLTIIPASVYQMMKGVLVVSATIYSIIFLKRQFYRHHYTALVIVIIGVILVGSSSIIYPDNSKSDEVSAGKLIFGISLEVVALLFIGANWIVEEKLFHLYYLNPIQVVGWEGTWATSVYLLLLVIFQFIPCHIDSICRYGTVEDSIHAFYEWGQNIWICILSFALIIWTALFNISDVAVTKYASSAQRATVDTCRTAIIWCFFMIYPGQGKERFIWIELLGFFFLIVGTLIHTEILVVPFFGFNKNTKKAIEERDQLENYDQDENLDKNEEKDINHTLLSSKDSKNSNK